MLAREVGVRVRADQTLDAALAGADRRLAEQLDHAELGGAVRVGAAAELARVVADLDDPHSLAVLLAEHRDRADALRLVLRGDEGAHVEVGEQDRR